MLLILTITMELNTLMRTKSNILLSGVITSDS